MTLTPDQYSEIAEGYARSTLDPSVPPEAREEFAKKAEWFRFLAERARKHGTRFESTSSPQYSIFEEDRSGRSRPRSFKPFLTTLWLVGAAVYFITTLLFSHAANLSGNDDRKTPSALPLIWADHPGAPAAPASSEIELQKGANVQQRIPTSDTRQHAVSLDGPATESPTISPSSSPSRSEEANSLDGAAQETSTNQKPEILAVTARTIVRNAPSETAQQIGIAQRGAQLQVIERDHEWLHFLDPSSGNKGWIQSSFVAAPNDLAQTDAPVNSASPHIAKRKPKIFTQEQPHIKTLPKPQANAYAGLPPDEEFLPRRMRAPRFLNRRRMFGEGLMSPGFLPPE
jgi:hypothetical protein